MLRGDRVKNLKDMYTTLIGPIGVMYLCAYCFKPITEAEVEVDHIYPHSRGGSNRLKNLVPSCKRCNLRKSDKVDKRYIVLGILNKVLTQILKILLMGVETGFWFIVVSIIVILRR